MGRPSRNRSSGSGRRNELTIGFRPILNGYGVLGLILRRGRLTSEDRGGRGRSGWPRGRVLALPAIILQLPLLGHPILVQLEHRIRRMRKVIRVRQRASGCAQGPLRRKRKRAGEIPRVHGIVERGRIAFASLLTLDKWWKSP